LDNLRISHNTTGTVKSDHQMFHCEPGPDSGHHHSGLQMMPVGFQVEQRLEDYLSPL
jgi:hypothetical protein